MSEIHSRPANPVADRHGAVTRFQRHPLPVRLFHWINALSFVLLLMSGLQIFNSYPRLHWGYVGYHTTPAVFEISGNKDPLHPQTWIQIGTHRLGTTGVLGALKPTTFYGTTHVAFPGWATLPSGPMNLGGGRAWHFLMIWVFFLNLVGFIVYGMLSGRIWRMYVPRRQQLQPQAVLADIRMHLRFERATPAQSLQYNLLQKLAYLGVVFGLLPDMVLTGMTMSPSAVAAFPWLIDLFHGRQTARTLHFAIATLLFLFLLVHTLQVFVSGFTRHMRSIITGYFVASDQEHP